MRKVAAPVLPWGQREMDPFQIEPRGLGCVEEGQRQAMREHLDTLAHL